MPKHRVLMTLLLFVFSTFAHSADPLFTATFSGKHSGFKVVTKRTLSAEGDNIYSLHSQAKSRFATIEETSRFTLSDDRLVPLYYDYRRKVFGIKKDREISFDWKNNRATFREGKDSKTVKNLDQYRELLDPSLYQLAIQRDIFLGKQQLSYDFVRDHRIKTYQFARAGEETLELDGKNLQTVKIERNEDNGPKKTTIWLIPELTFQIGKIEHTDEDGESYGMQLVDYQCDFNRLTALFNRHKQSE